MSNSLRKCALRSCSKRNPPETMIIKGIQAWCNHDCQAAHAIQNLKKMRANSDRAAKNEEKEKRKLFRRRKQKLNESDIKWQKKRTKDVVHEVVKLLDKDQGCIVCGGLDCILRSEADAGHYLTKAAHPELKFDPRNIFKQCSLTNTASNRPSATEASIRVKFEQGIIARMGLPYLQWLRSCHPPVKYTCDGLAAYGKEGAADVARLKRGEPASRDWRALPVDTTQ